MVAYPAFSFTPKLAAVNSIVPSLSRMVTVALSGEPIWPPGALNNVTLTVSGWSWVGLSKGTTGIFKELAPAGIVTEVPIGTRSDPLVAVPLAWILTRKAWAVLRSRVMGTVPG